MLRRTAHRAGAPTVLVDCKQALHEQAEEAAAAVNGEGVERVVDLAAIEDEQREHLAKLPSGGAAAGGKLRN